MIHSARPNPGGFLHARRQKRTACCNFASKIPINPYNVNTQYVVPYPTSGAWTPVFHAMAMRDQAERPDPAADAHPSDGEDVSLMEAVGRGDHQAMASLVSRWQGPVINYFYRSLGSLETAEDLSQQLFVRIYRAAPRYAATAKFSTYLFSIARRLLINEYRRRQRKPLDPVDPSDLQGETEGREALERMEIEEAFAWALEALPENQKSALLLYKQQELSYQEIAAVLDTTESSVKTWIYRGRQKLKTILKDHLLK